MADEDEVQASATRNVVQLIGTLPAPAEERTMPSGDVLCVFRVAVPRGPGTTGSPGARRRQTDSLECVAWVGRVRRSAMGWRVGDIIEVSGALRRRFFTTAAGSASRVEVEVTSARRIARAPA